MNTPFLRNWISLTLKQAGWAPFSVFVFYAIAAKGFDAYLIYPWLDIPTHFAGGMAITHFYLAALTGTEPALGKTPGVIRVITAWGLTAITAIVWEFFEYLSDISFATLMNLGVADTLSDLFFGLAGGCLAIAVDVVLKQKTHRLQAAQA